MTYVNNLGLYEIATGAEDGTWGTKTNLNLELIADAFGSGTEAISLNADTHTTTIANGAVAEGRALFLKYTGTLDSACTITLAPNTINKVWFIENATAGSQNIIISQSGGGANVTIANGKVKTIYTDGTGGSAAVIDVFADMQISSTLTVDGASTLTGAVTATAGIVVSGTSEIRFGDAASRIFQSADGVLRIDGEATLDLYGSTSVNVSNDLLLNSDLAVLGFGANNDTTLTHVHDTGLILNSTRALQFGDSASYIQQSGDGVLRINGEATVDIYASTMVAISNDLRLNSDAAVLAFGADSEVTLTHVHDTGLLLNGSMSMTVADNSAALQLICTDADASAGPLLLLDRDTASPADGDAIGRIYSQGRNDADELVTYTMITSKSIDVTDGTEDGEMLFNVLVNGASSTVLDLYGPATQMNTTVLDLNGNLDVSGTSLLTGVVTASAGITCGDAAITNVGDIALDSISSDGTTAPWCLGTGSTGATEAADSVDNAGLFIRSNVNTGFGMALGTASSGDAYIQGVYQDGSSSKTIHLNPYAGNVAVAGALSKGSGSFKIDHPLPSMKDTHSLVHSFTESPRADLIYRGSVALSSGSASVDLDAEVGMADGTWELLCRDPQVFLQNESGWSALKGSVSGSTLIITCKDSISNDTVSWMVVAERQDEHMMDTSWTDDDGRPILEPLKPEEVEDGS